MSFYIFTSFYGCNLDKSMVIHVFFESIGAIRSYHFASQGGINKDPTVWLDGARPPPKYIFKNNMSSTNSKI
jgi:hypothetical protein